MITLDAQTSAMVEIVVAIAVLLLTPLASLIGPLRDSKIRSLIVTRLMADEAHWLVETLLQGPRALHHRRLRQIFGLHRALSADLYGELPPRTWALAREMYVQYEALIVNATAGKVSVAQTLLLVRVALQAEAALTLAEDSSEAKRVWLDVGFYSLAAIGTIAFICLAAWLSSLRIRH